MTSDAQVPGLTVDVHLDPGHLAAALRQDAQDGLGARPYHLPPKWFYDAAGSDLFDEITRLPEYYPTEAERAVLHEVAGTVVRTTRADVVVELGSGSSDKTRTLLDAFRRDGGLRTYVPFDVSESALRAAGEDLTQRYPGLSVHGVVGDFDHHLDRLPRDGHRLLVFLGGTLGNYAPGPRAALLNALGSTLNAGEWLLLGTDLVKDPARLVAAYDDAAGVTAAFNLNVLRVLNRELDAEFDLDRFAHVAVWNVEQEWIEMRLRSLEDQKVAVPALDLVVDLHEGEDILTEISAKFRRDGITAELAAAGFEVVDWWTDPAGDFAVSLSRRTD